MKIFQKEFKLKSRGKGFYLITNEVIDNLTELREIKTGMLHLLIKHTSAALSLNENADPDVRADMEKYFDKNVKENEPYYVHTAEGPDDMPAHIKSVVIGSSLNIPVTNGRLNLGTWQGIYLCEFRKALHSRSIVATLIGV